MIYELNSSWHTLNPNSELSEYLIDQQLDKMF